MLQEGQHPHPFPTECLSKPDWVHPITPAQLIAAAPAVAF